MTTTVEQLEQRLVAVEEEVRQLRQPLEPSPLETSAERGARLWAQARREKPRLKAIMAKVLEQMGIAGEPVPPQQLRAMMAASGIKPEDNLFSRGILEMREE